MQGSLYQIKVKLLDLLKIFQENFLNFQSKIFTLVTDFIDLENKINPAKLRQIARPCPPNQFCSYGDGIQVQLITVTLKPVTYPTTKMPSTTQTTKTTSTITVTVTTPSTPVITQTQTAPSQQTTINVSKLAEATSSYIGNEIIMNMKKNRKKSNKTKRQRKF
ncbi:Hypothetical protein SRAE_X000033800 [Strongyloides ratti]|uniref:Uncharacterized protein n=1 Tax=Strongyloides ratti TaxID=34506 RepID=A0A090LMP2_STRRB|nr:Hypothetical protein SRAE_X000033800 [Strongyloides ratti]CEF71011.1 Hypothetical protein SRAE_X000033800 [Strongyloides ratti]